MNREEIEKLLTEWEQYKIPRLYEGGAIDVMRLLINEFASINQDSFLPPAEGAEAILLKHCKENKVFLTSNELHTILDAMREFAAQPQPTAEGAEEILLSHPYLKVMYDDTAGEVCMVEQAIWAIEKFATLHAQRIAEKIVEEKLKKEYERGIEDGKIIGKHGSASYIE